MYDVAESIIGKDYKQALEICNFNGFNLGYGPKFWSIGYEIFNDLIVKSYYI